MKQTKDIDYVFISTRVKAMERGLLTRERIERMLDAATNEEAAKVLTECGYPELSELSGDGVERALAQKQKETMADLGSSVPDKTVVDVFRVRYDYHNAKALVKAEALHTTADGLMLWGGRYDPETLAQDFAREDLNRCSEIFRRAVERAREVLGSTGDPQLADFVLDKAYFEELASLAQGTDSRFLRGYVALLIDCANLRSAVRASRLGKGREFLGQVLAPGGNVSDQTVAAARGEDLGNVYHSGPLAEAAKAGAALSAPGSGALTDFERLCDDAVMSYLDGARMAPFGEQPVIGYLYAREAEMTAVRIIMNGRFAGLDRETIRQRLRRTNA